MLTYSSLVDELELACKLQRYKPPRFFPRNGCTSGKSNRKRPYAIAYKWIGIYLVRLEKFEGRCNVLVYDESMGYDKVLASAKGLDQSEAESIYDTVVKTVQRW